VFLRKRPGTFLDGLRVRLMFFPGATAEKITSSNTHSTSIDQRRVLGQPSNPGPGYEKLHKRGSACAASRNKHRRKKEKLGY